MDHPKCKICGERHRLGACLPTIEIIPPGPYVDPHQRGAAPEPIGSAVVRELKFDRVAYQREYMRKWRLRNKST